MVRIPRRPCTRGEGRRPWRLGGRNQRCCAPMAKGRGHGVGGGSGCGARRTPTSTVRCRSRLNGAPPGRASPPPRAAGPSLPWSSRPACRRIWWWSGQVLLILRQWGREARTLPRHTGCVLGSFCCCVASLGFTEVSFFTCPGTPASILRCVPLPPAPNPSGRPPSHLACCPASPFSTRAIREEATS